MIPHTRSTQLTLLPSYLRTVIGIRCKDGVVLGVEKPVLSKMLVEGSNRKVFAVDRHAGMVSGGLTPDGRMLSNRATEEASNYKQFYGEPIPGTVLSERLASYVHVFTLYWSVRPFGASALLAIYDHDGPALYHIEPSGASHRRADGFFSGLPECVCHSTHAV